MRFLRAHPVFSLKSKRSPRCVCTQAVPRLHGRELGVALAALFSISACGSPGNDCLVPEAHCDGNIASNCTYREDVATSYQTWKTTSCGAGTCQVDDQGAFCALTSAPDPRCDAADTPFCAGALVTRCRAGYAISTDDCGSGTHDPFCVDASAKSVFNRHGGVPDGVAFCAAEAEANAICQAAFQNEGDPVLTCDGNDQLQCWYGYLLKRMTLASCGSG